MEAAEIRDYLDGFMAWDHGVRSSGIKHDSKRAEIKELMRKMADARPGVFREIAWPLVVRHGTFEDAQETLNWLREYLDFDDWSGM